MSASVVALFPFARPAARLVVFCPAVNSRYPSPLAMRFAEAAPLFHPEAPVAVSAWSTIDTPTGPDQTRSPTRTSLSVAAAWYREASTRSGKEGATVLV